MPVIILLLAAGYLLTVYLILAWVHHTTKMTPNPSSSSRQTSSIP